MTEPSLFLQSIECPSLYVGLSKSGQIISTLWNGEDLPPRSERSSICEAELAKVAKNGVLSIDLVCNALLALINDYTVKMNSISALEMLHGVGFKSKDRTSLEATLSDISDKEHSAFDFLRNCPVTSAEDALRILSAMSHPDLSDPPGRDVRRICNKALMELDHKNWAKQAA